LFLQWIWEWLSLCLHLFYFRCCLDALHSEPKYYDNVYIHSLSILSSSKCAFGLIAHCDLTWNMYRNTSFVGNKDMRCICSGALGSKFGMPWNVFSGYEEMKFYTQKAQTESMWLDLTQSSIKAKRRRREE
jgi:hypothetical protein